MRMGLSWGRTSSATARPRMSWTRSAFAGSYNRCDMARINDHYLKLKAGYLFPEINRRVRAFSEANPDAKIIRMGIGDVTEPLPGACVAAMHIAEDELSRRETFRGDGP